MRKETDLPKVKMIAHVLLDMPIAETSFSPAIVSHPFTSTGVTAAQNEDGNITVVDLLNNKEDYAKWKEMVGIGEDRFTVQPPEPTLSARRCLDFSQNISAGS